MESNIKNAKFTIFNSKEEYLNMRQAWKDYHNQGHAKGVWVETYHKVRDWKTNSVVDHINKTKITPLGPSHYILYNLLRGKPAHIGFMQDWTQPTDGYAGAYVSLENQLEVATKPLIFADNTSEGSKKWAIEWKQRAFERLMKPFGETLTEEHLATVLKLMKDGHYRNLLEDKEEEEAAVA